MDQQILQNMGLMLASALAILLIFLPPVVAVTVAVCVTIVIELLVGHVMTGWDVDLNLVRAIVCCASMFQNFGLIVHASYYGCVSIYIIRNVRI